MIPIPAFSDNYIWISPPDNQNAVFCVDPGEAHQVIKFLEEKGLSLKGILLTHHHPDHSGGITELAHYNPNLVIYAPNDSRLPSLPQLISDKAHIEICKYQFDIMSIPGHTSSHIAFYEPHHGKLFCGDTLFSAGCGRVFDGTIEQLADSLNKLACLPDATKIYCGHEYTRNNLRFAATIEPNNQFIKTHYQYLLGNPLLCSLPSTMKQEKEINPFLRLNEPEVKEYALRHGANPLDSLAIFSLLREKKNQFT